MLHRGLLGGCVLACAAALVVSCGGGDAAVELPEVASSNVSAAAASPAQPPSAVAAVPLDCDTVLTAVWPAEADVPAAPGWDGPRCVEDPPGGAEGDDVGLTWVSVAGNVTPESADAAFVELQSGFERSGWRVSEPRTGADPEDAGEGRLVRCELEAPGGELTGTMAYRPMDASRASLEVRFQG